MELDGRHAGARLQRFVADEPAWRQFPHTSLCRAPDDVVIGHWADARLARRELTAPVLEGHYTVSILLGRASVDCYKNGRLLGRGTGGRGGLQLTTPGEAVVCAFRGANEALHLFFPDALVEAEHGTQPRLDDPAFLVDPVLVSYALRVVSDAESHQVVREILRHVLSRYAREPAGAPPARGLCASRLRRVLDYIDANLAEPVMLNDIARHAGLSRMHFAAQFRLATGQTPHAYLNGRRVERAKALIAQGMAIADAALAVGFPGQAHFTSVFRALNGEPPGRWRTQRQQAGSGTPSPDPAVRAR